MYGANGTLEEAIIGSMSTVGRSATVADPKCLPMFLIDPLRPVVSVRFQVLEPRSLQAIVRARILTTPARPTKLRANTAQRYDPRNFLKPFGGQAPRIRPNEGHCASPGAAPRRADRADANLIARSDATWPQRARTPARCESCRQQPQACFGSTSHRPRGSRGTN